MNPNEADGLICGRRPSAGLAVLIRGRRPSAGPADRDPVARRLFFVTLALLALITIYSRPYAALPQPNELSRLYLTRAIAENGRLDVLEQLRRWGNIDDLSAHQGRPFTDKAPGSSFIALPAWVIARSVGGPHFGNYTLSVAARFMIVLPLSLATTLFILPRLLSAIGVRPGVHLVTSIALGAGSVWLTYSEVYFGHVLAGAALIAMLLFVVLAREADRSGDASARNRVDRTLAASGVLGGVAGLVEYQAGAAAALIALFALITFKRRAIYVALGALPFVVMLLLYDWYCFGSPFELSYRDLVWGPMREKHSSGFAGIGLPTVEGLVGISISRNRGLLFWSPVLLLAPWGVVLLYRRDRALSIIVAAVIALYVLLVASSSVWHGGWSLGPRLLVAVFPIAMVGVAVAIEQALTRPWTTALVVATVVYGLLIVPIATAIVPGLSSLLATPFADAHLSLLRCGILPTNLGTRLGLDGALSLLPLFACALALGFVVAFSLASELDGKLRLSVVAGAVGPLVLLFAMRGRTLAPEQRADLLQHFADLQAAEPSRAGKPVVHCAP